MRHLILGSLNEKKTARWKIEPFYRVPQNQPVGCSVRPNYPYTMSNGKKLLGDNKKCEGLNIGRFFVIHADSVQVRPSARMNLAIAFGDKDL